MQQEGPVVVSESELARRTIRRSDFVSCNQAFIDCRTPGSDLKENYAMIGPGVSQNSKQIINLREPHGFNIGAAAMPHGVTNNLHLHFTAEVFLCFHGEYQVRWGADGNEGELTLRAGDIASIPAWTFRGFTNTGPDDGWLFTSLGRDSTGGIIWGPSVLREAAEHGLYLAKDGQLIDTVVGDSLPGSTELVSPMDEADIAALRSYSVEEMRSRVATPDDLTWSEAPFLDSAVSGGGAELALVVGFGMTEDREQRPRIVNPHGQNLAWLRARPGNGMLRHRVDEAQVLIVEEGRWEVTLNDHGPVSVELNERDMLSVPPGAWRSLRNVGAGTGRLLVISSGDGRVRPTWDEEVVEAAADAGFAIDHDGYVAPRALVPRARG